MCRVDRRNESHLPSVLLRHRAPRGSHHDWLLADPNVPDAALWAGRVRLHSRHWRSLRGWYVQQIAPHRRRYLTYEGDLGGGRGTVERVDEGTFVTRQWEPDRILIDLTMAHCRGLVLLRRVGVHRWWAKVVAPPSAKTLCGYD